MYDDNEPTVEELQRLYNQCFQIQPKAVFPIIPFTAIMLAELGVLFCLLFL